MQLTLTVKKRKDGFRLQVIEKTKDKSKKILDTEITLPRENTAIFGFEDSMGKIYFLSFYRENNLENAGDTPADVSHQGVPELAKRVNPVYPPEAVNKEIEDAYINGFFLKGDAEAIEKGFHPKCEMVRFLYIDIHKQPISHWIDHYKKYPGPSYKDAVYQFRSLTVAERIANAVVEVKASKESTFTAHFSLFKLKEGWFLLKAEPIVSTKDLESVNRGRVPRGNPAISISFKPESAEKMKVYTTANQGKRLAIMLDNKVISVPMLGGMISKHCMIEGNFTMDEVNEIIMQLKIAIDEN